MSVYYDIFRNPIPVNNTTTYRMYKLASRNKRNGAALNSISNSKGRYVMENGHKAKLVKKLTNNNKNMNTWNWNNTKKNNNNNNNVIKNTITNVNLPNNGAIDPISLHVFNKGNNAIMVTQTTKTTNGTNKKHKFYYQQNSLEKLAKKNWNTILQTKPTIYLFTNPETKVRVHRGDLKKVKFVKNKNS